MKALEGAFNQEKALVGAFSVIVQPVVEPMDRFTALINCYYPLQAGVPPHLHEAVASLVEQVLDPGHLGDRVTVLGLKTVLAVMTKARLRDRLAFLFREHSDYQVQS